MSNLREEIAELVNDNLLYDELKLDKILELVKREQIGFNRWMFKNTKDYFKDENGVEWYKDLQGNWIVDIDFIDLYNSTK